MKTDHDGLHLFLAIAKSNYLASEIANSLNIEVDELTQLTSWKVLPDSIKIRVARALDKDIKEIFNGSARRVWQTPVSIVAERQKLILDN